MTKSHGSSTPFPGKFAPKTRKFKSFIQIRVHTMTLHTETRSINYIHAFKRTLNQISGILHNLETLKNDKVSLFIDTLSLGPIYTKHIHKFKTFVHIRLHTITLKLCDQV